jgi:predicted aconitase
VPIRLNDEERAMLAGELGGPRRWALAQQIAVGDFLDAVDLVPVSQVQTGDRLRIDPAAGIVEILNRDEG